MMKQIDWAGKKIMAKRMTDDELRFAIKDCLEAASCHPRDWQEGYYHDEASVYRAEQDRRKK